MKNVLIGVVIIAVILAGASIYLYSQNTQIKAELDKAKAEITALKVVKDNANKKVALIADIIEKTVGGQQGDPAQMLIDIEKKIDQIQDEGIRKTWDSVKKSGDGNAFLSFLRTVLQSVQKDLK